MENIERLWDSEDVGGWRQVTRDNLGTLPDGASDAMLLLDN